MWGIIKGECPRGDQYWKLSYFIIRKTTCVQTFKLKKKAK